MSMENKTIFRYGTRLCNEKTIGGFKSPRDTLVRLARPRIKNQTKLTFT